MTSLPAIPYTDPRTFWIPAGCGDIEAATVELGARALDARVRKGKPETLTPTDVLVGPVYLVKAFFRSLGREVPETSCYPKCVKPALRRDVRLTTIGELWDAPSHAGFLKPVLDKQFAAGGYRDRQELMELTMNRGPEDRVWASPLVSFSAEWRCYVAHGKLVDVRRYRGDFCHDVAVLNMVVDMCNAALEADTARELPPGCSIDIGYSLQTGVAVVEVNPGFALGSYGCDPHHYCEVLASWWAWAVEQTAAKVTP